MARKGNKTAVSKPIKGMYTAQEAANLAGVSRQRLQFLRAQGLSPAFHEVKTAKSVRVYYPKDSFDEWLANKK